MILDDCAAYLFSCDALNDENKISLYFFLSTPDTKSCPVFFGEDYGFILMKE